MLLTQFRPILRTLAEARVDYVLVGGLSAVLNGAPINTFDLDIVPSREPANVERLLAALETLDAFFRMQPERRLRPNASQLTGSGHLNLVTRYGPLDVLCEIGEALSYLDLVPDSPEMHIDSDLKIRVLSLEALIGLKSKLGNAKDVAALPILRQTVAEQRRRQK